MIRIKLSGAQAFKAELRAYPGQVKDQFADMVRDKVYGIHEEVIKSTPVDSGEAVASWQVAADVAFSGDVGPVGPRTPGSGSLPLGSEPNRPAAEAVARRSQNIDFRANPFRVFYVSNNAAHILGLEFGEYSTRGSAMLRNGVAAADFLGVQEVSMLKIGQ